MDILLQIWGGGFYLLNKILFALAEGRSEEMTRRLRVAGWIVYISGVPAWVMILVMDRNWIAASIEAGGIPSMILGLVTVYQLKGSSHKSLDRAAAFFTYVFLVAGIGYSLYDYGGIISVSQVLEIGVTVGFLAGGYLLAKKNMYGWLFFMLMNGSMAALMLLQHKPFLSAQQIISLCFVIYGFVMAVKTSEQG